MRPTVGESWSKQNKAIKNVSPGEWIEKTTTKKIYKFKWMKKKQIQFHGKMDSKVVAKDKFCQFQVKFFFFGKKRNKF